jgi:glutamate-ammonia-ligase adenylyltransferase
MTPNTIRPRDLLLNEQVGLNHIETLLRPIGFADWRLAWQRLQRIPPTPAARLALANAMPHLLMALATAAHPDRVLVSFERFVGNAPEPSTLLQYLAANPRALEIMVTLFAGSQFLTEILLRHPQYFEQLTARKHLAERKTARQLYLELEAILEPAMAAPGSRAGQMPALLDLLRRFQRRELLRIGTYDLLDLFDLPTVITQLSHLADSLIQACLMLAAWQSNINPAGFCVLSMGKLGGQELNYSSDIDLLFVATGHIGQFMDVGQQLINGLSRATPEGFLYRVDMRLRPWGKSGPLVSTVEGHLDYLTHHAGLWEKQALLKARVVAGDRAVGRAFLEQAAPLIFSAAGPTVQADVRAMKERIEAQLRRRGTLWGEVKLGRGSIRDIEFVTQYLQLAHGAQHPTLHLRSTLAALAQLAAAGLLPSPDYRVLADGYIFLRTVEHHLQLMHYRQTHTLPDNPAALTHLARRLRFQGHDAGEQFVERYQQHSLTIRAVYRRYLETDNVGGFAMTQTQNQALTRLKQHVTRLPETYTQTFTPAEIARHAELISRLGDNNLIEVDAIPQPGHDLWRITLVGYDHVGQLSLICGLLFYYGFDIVDGHVFSYGRQNDAPQPKYRAKPAVRFFKQRYSSRFTPPPPDTRRKIVDVFTVRSLKGPVSPQIWANYDDDLTALSWRLHAGEQHEAQGELAKRVAQTLRSLTGDAGALYPVEITIDNDQSERHTVLVIDAMDTVGFLYELTNALALIGINIRHMTVDTAGSQVHDVLYVTDTQGQKITDPDRMRKLRAAAALIKEFTHLLPRSPNPESALLNFRQFIGYLFNRPNWPDELTSLERPEVLNTLARLLGVSEFLWTDFLRMQYANLFPVVSDVAGLAGAKTKAQHQAALANILQAAPTPEAKRQALNDFKDREMFRIDMRQIQEHITEFGQFSAELSDLAEVVVEGVVHLCLAELEAEFGRPAQSNGQPCPLAVCALGKCGGRELGFASDIELMFIFNGQGKTTGPREINAAEFYERLVQEVNQAIQAKREGIFELDLRLRPYGKAGSMAVSLDSFRRYFNPAGDAWPYERQSLIKLRPIAGDIGLGHDIVRLRDELIYSGQPFDVAAMRAMRERQGRHLVTAGTINAKFSPGGLVDIEYLVQGLQINHGPANPDLRSPNTREAMAALTRHSLITAEEYQQLYQAHVFIRRLINALRMVRGHAKDLTAPPAHSEEFDFLARRLNYGDNPAQLHHDLVVHTSRVQQLSVQLLG